MGRLIVSGKPGAQTLLWLLEVEPTAYPGHAYTNGATTYNICKAGPWNPESRWIEDDLTAADENYAVLNQEIPRKKAFT